MTKGKQLAGRKVPQTSTLFVLSRSFPPCCSLLARPNSKWLFLQKILAIHRFLGDCVSSHFVSNSMRINAILPLPIETCFLSQLIHKDGPQKYSFCQLGISPLCVQYQHPQCNDNECHMAMNSTRSRLNW